MSNICVYIDADNINSKYFPMLYNELQNINGIIQNVYIYADWSKKETANWLKISKSYGYIPRMATKLTGVKETSDMVLVLDIMEHLYTCKSIDTFCIVSSDSDFTHIVNKLKINSKNVYGFGMSYTNKTLINTFHTYFFLDIILHNKKCIKFNNYHQKKLKNIIYNDSIKIINKFIKNIGSFNSTRLYDELIYIYPTFNYKNYGFEKYIKFILFNFKNKYNITVEGNEAWFISIK